MSDESEDAVLRVKLMIDAMPDDIKSVCEAIAGNTSKVMMERLIEVIRKPENKDLSNHAGAVFIGASCYYLGYIVHKLCSVNNLDMCGIAEDVHVISHVIEAENIKKSLVDQGVMPQDVKSTIDKILSLVVEETPKGGTVR